MSVADEGEGVPPDLLPRLFRKEVRRAEGSVGGSGLGLAICKGLVEAHGGRIWAESDGAGLGTRFTFTLQAVEEPDAERGVASRGAEPSGRTPILVVDDDPEALRYVRGALEDAGYAPIVTGDPREVADLIRSKRPRLVLLDLVLPGTDGIAMMANVPELADLPVIFISGYGRDETVARALESGAVDYLVKPFSPTDGPSARGPRTARAGSAAKVAGEQILARSGSLTLGTAGAPHYGVTVVILCQLRVRRPLQE